MFHNLTKIGKIMIGILVAYIIWMLFFDENSYLTHRQLDDEVEKVEKSATYFKNEIKKDSIMLKKLNEPKSLEKFAREKYKMKKENEDVFLIEFDTLK